MPNIPVPFFALSVCGTHCVVIEESIGLDSSTLFRYSIPNGPEIAKKKV